MPWCSPTPRIAAGRAPSPRPQTSTPPEEATLVIDGFFSALVYNLGWSTGSNHDAYEKQTITGPSGSVRSRSSVGWDRGFTGYVVDSETGLLHARARQYSPTLGRFVGRDPWGYYDNYSFYIAGFSPASLDPSGAYIEEDYTPKSAEGTPWSNAALPPRVGGETLGGSLVTCWCDSCSFLSQGTSNKQCGKMVNCKITASFWIHIDLSKLPVQGKKFLYTKENVYGHEQLHVKSYLDYFHELKNAYDSETGYCTEPGTCAEEAKRIADEMNLMIKGFETRDKKHENPGGPANAVPRDPIGPMPPETK